MSAQIRATLRGLATFPDELRVLDPDEVPADPMVLLLPGSRMPSRAGSGNRMP